MKYELKNGEVLKDGHTMFIEDVVKDLNYYNRKFHEQKEQIECVICTDCGEFNCDCDWFVLNRLNRQLRKEIDELKEEKLKHTYPLIHKLAKAIEAKGMKIVVNNKEGVTEDE